MSHDFYVVLGVSKDADLRQIRRAYRRLVKLYHPDVTDAPVEKFLEIQKAYETLCAEEPRDASDKVSSKSHPPAEPLLVKRRSRTPVATEKKHANFSVVDEFFSGWVPGFFTKGRQTSRQKNLYVELILDPEEASRGGMFPLQIPTEQVCGQCDGSGYQGELSCPGCHGSGRSVSYHEIEVSVPPGVTNRTEARISLGDIGLNGVDLIVLVSVT